MDNIIRFPSDPDFREMAMELMEEFDPDKSDAVMVMRNRKTGRIGIASNCSSFEEGNGRALGLLVLTQSLLTNEILSGFDMEEK